MSAVEVQPASLSMSSSPSPGDSVSLLEIMEDTRLVLNAFLRKTLTLPLSQRPGRVGGAYRDSTKLSARKTANMSWVEDGWDSLDEKISAAEGKKHGFKDLIKKKLQPRRLSGSGQPKKDIPNAELKVDQAQIDVQGDLSKLEVSENGGHSSSLKLKLLKHESEEVVVSSSSSDEDSERKDKKKKKKKTLSSLLRKLRTSKKEEPHDDSSRPKRPSSLSFRGAKTPADPSCPSPPISPSARSPQFYEEVAGTLDRIAQKHTVTRPTQPSSHSQPVTTTESNDKEAVVRQLVDLVSMQGDAINEKIEADPFLRSTLTRLSYPSFAKLLDMFADASKAPAPAQSDSTTLSHVAVTMEVSRRILTANGTQRMQGYAERYMQKFVPWVQSQGGWEKIVQSGNLPEYD